MTTTTNNKLNLQWVSETVGNKYKQWNSGDCVLIESQTGTGKTHFIKNTLTKYAYSKNKKILYICNRTNLKRQIKIDIAEMLKLNISMEDIDKRETFGNITITSYQSVSNNLLDVDYNVANIKHKDYDYVVLDECHYLFQDASFNNKIIFFLENFKMKNATMIVISATMQHIKPLILEQFKDSKLWEYNTGKDYSYCNVFYFKDNKDIINTIKNDNSGDKWLVFINNINKAKDMLNEIVGSKLICSEGSKDKDKMDYKEKDNILLNNQFDCKCLIATKALDNGINIDDILLRNIVIITLDEIDFIQMLGRKRVNIENAQRINVYIKQRSKKTFYTLLEKHCNYGLKLVNMFTNDNVAFCRKYDIDYSKLGKHSNLFYKDSQYNNWVLNFPAYEILRRQKLFCQTVLDSYELFGDIAFIHTQLNWLGLEYDDNNWIKEVVDNMEVERLEDYLESITGKKLFEEDQITLTKMIMNELLTVGTEIDYRTKKIRFSTLEKIIRDDLGLEFYISKPKQERSINSANLNKSYIVLSKLQNV